ncbi:MAG TPA: site-specific DNA-methyltransferase [Clostridiaceae bacterium]|nr:site-specific DNA-methyltransferase [Clostridiaceae bacterium]
MIKDILDRNETISAKDREISVLREYFPACFSQDGSFDLERFKEYISDKVDVKSEGYELKFLGKNYARLLASLDTTTVIKPNKEHNEKPENKDSENLYITGDNLDGLKHLLKSYAGAVKCIYIDPPYNTGSDGFVYNDRFEFTVDDLMEKLSISETQAQRILDLTKRGSASHSAWLMFMYPRLQLARNLLSDDGVIFISIDDNEQANLKLICDDVFGEENFAGELIWQKKKGGSNDAKHIAIEHETILFCCKNLSKLPNLYHAYDGEYSKRYKETDENGKFFWDTFKRKSGKQYYPIECPDGSVLEKDDYGNPISWLRSKNRFIKDLKNNEARIIKINDSWSVQFKQRMPKGKKPRSLLLKYGTTSNGNAELLSFFKKDLFDNPKPTALLKHLISFGTIEDSIILDFFSGSATTADAIMQLNAEDGGKRKFIMVQLPEVIEEGKPAYNAGYRTIDEIGRERIIRAAKKIKEENSGTNADLGFKHFVLEEPKGKQLDEIIDFDRNVNELVVTNNLLEEFGVNTVLTTWLVRDGYGFSSKVEAITFGAYTGYHIDKHLYLINQGLDNAAIETIVTKFDTDPNFNPENVVLFGYSFTWTEMEALQTNLKRLKATEKNLRINFDIRY